MNRANAFSLVVILTFTITCLSPQGGEARELSTSDFKFDGPFGSEGATIEKIGINHFKVVLGHAPEHPSQPLLHPLQPKGL